MDFVRTFSTGKIFMNDSNQDPLMGKPAPEFCLPDADEKTICLADHSGSWVILYFYPRDNTPGCTLEARGFSDAVDDFSTMGAVILGVSGDSVDSHKKFAEKQNLRFPILSDTSHAVLKSYGVWKEKKGIGALFSTERSTFLIDPEGIIAVVWRKVRVFGHVGDVRARLKELSKKA
jgi:thioredoxin-dependent peroxiredoxin